MSERASELLRGLAQSLEPQGEYDLAYMLMHGDDSEDEARLFAALPEIIAVVEAAEYVEKAAFNMPPELRLSLAALASKLSGETG